MNVCALFFSVSILFFLNLLAESCYGATNYKFNTVAATAAKASKTVATATATETDTPDTTAEATKTDINTATNTATKTAKSSVARQKISAVREIISKVLML